MKLVNNMNYPNESSLSVDNRPKLENIRWANPDNLYQDRFNKLIERIKTPESYCAIFVGAGISAGIFKEQYPVWSDIVKELEGKLKVGLDKPAEDMDGDEIYEYMEKCKNKDKNQFYSQLRIMFDPETHENYRSLHRYIIEVPFCNILTTNIDPCLMNYLNELKISNPCLKRKAYCNPQQLADKLLREENIYHIHGIYLDENKNDYIEDAILTMSQYNEAYSYDSNLYRFLKSAFSKINYIFVGSSLRDTGIINIIDEIDNELMQQSGKTFKQLQNMYRYIIVPEEYQIVEEQGTESKNIRNETKEREQEEFFKKRGIDIIRYAIKENYHKQLENVLKNIYTLTRG